MKGLVPHTRLSILLFAYTLSAFLLMPDTGIALGQEIELSAEERACLESHRDIELGYTATLEPDVIVNPDGSVRGILVDIVAELNQRLGTSIGLRIHPIAELLEKAQQKEIDGLLSLHPGYADELGLLKTRSYITNYPAVFARANVPFESPLDFAGKTVAVIDRLYFSRKIIEQYGRGATILKVPDSRDGLQRVIRGQADFFLGATLNAFLIAKYQLYDIAAPYVFNDDPIEVVIGTRPDWPELSSILDKGLSSFSMAELAAITAKWSYLPEKQQTSVDLTPEERDWLAEHPEISIGLPEGLVPYVMKDHAGNILMAGNNGITGYSTVNQLVPHSGYAANWNGYVLSPVSLLPL